MHRRQHTKQRTRRQPDFLHVVLEDLSSAQRLERLRRQAVRLQLISASSCDRLRFFAAATHAQRVGASNPCGLFVATVRKQRWAYLTQADEDAASSLIRNLETSAAPRPKPSRQEERRGLEKLVETLAARRSLQSELERRNARRFASSPARKRAA